MKKARSNALWNKLSPEQSTTLDKWLFEEKLGYVEVLAKAKNELGFKGSIGSLKRYYDRRSDERTLMLFEGLQKNLAVVEGAPGDVNSWRGGTMKLLAAFLFQQAHEAPERLKELGALANLIVNNDHNEAMREMKGEEHRVRRELKAEDQRIRREALAFAKEKFEFGTMELALKALPQLQELAEAKKDPRTKRYQENAYWNRLRRAMFGAGLEIHPESAEEEAAMIAAKKEREARKARAAKIDQELIIDAQPPPPTSPYYQEYIQKLARHELEDWEMAAEYEI